MRLSDIQKEVHHVAKAKGWYDKERSIGESIALIHSELSEALECYRNNESQPVWQTTDKQEIIITPISDSWRADVKPEGILTELADSVIRIMDLCESKGWDLEKAIKLKHEFNKTRPHRHGGKVI